MNQKFLTFATLLALLLVEIHTGFAAAPTRKEAELGTIQRQRVQKKGKEKAEQRFSRGQAFIASTETQLLSEIKKAIGYLERTYKSMPKKSTARLEMREKLVNLYMESAVYTTNQEMRKYDISWNRWEANGRRGREPKLSTSGSKRNWNKLSNEATSVLREYPRSKNADVMMFNLGLAQNFLNRQKDAARTFSQLIQKYPNSQKAGDAYFALGDFYFDKTDFRNAMNNYKNALRFKQSKTYSWALFKLGWCSYNLGNYRGSLNYWKQTVSSAKTKGKRGVPLKEEALRDMVYSFAELKQVEPAIAYYRRNGGSKYIGRFLILLSNTFSDQGRYSSAIKVLKRYQQVEPYAEGAPDTQKEIILLNFELGKMREVWRELARFPALYGPKSRWAGKNRSNKRLFIETQQMIKDQVIYYAKLTHKNAQKNDNKRLYAEAKVGYKLYLKNYPRSKEVAEVKWLMADIEYFEKSYNESGRLFLEIGMLPKSKAVRYEGKKTINIHKDAADGMMESYSLDFDPEYRVMLKRKPDFKKGKRPLTPRARNFVKSCGYYQKWYPQDKKTAKKCDVFITQIYYRSNDKRNSLKWLWVLARRYPGSKEGNEAVESLIPLYQGNKKGLAKAAQDLLKIPAYSKGKLGKKLRELAEGLELDAIMATKNRNKRADLLMAKYKKNPKGSESDKLVYNAAGDYLSSNMAGPAIAAYAIVVNRHPKSAGAQDSLIQLAKLTENQVDFASSAGYYYKYYQKYPKDKLAVGALAKACLLRAALDTPNATSTCLSFAQRDAGTAKSIFYSMMQSAYSGKQIGKLNSLVRTFNSKFKVSAQEQVASYAMVYFVNNGKGGSASQAGNQILSGFKAAGGNIEGEPLRAVGEIIFKRVNGELNRFEKYSLKGGTVETLLQTIQQKGAALQKLIGAYQQVLQTGDAYWGVAALVQIGKAHESLANDLAAPPQIKGAPYTEVVKQLAPQAAGVRKEAIAFYKKAVSSIDKFMVYNEWAGQARSGLARMEGKKIAYDDLIVTPDFFGSEVSTSVADAVRGKGH